MEFVTKMKYYRAVRWYIICHGSFMGITTNGRRTLSTKVSTLVAVVMEPEGNF